jgi:hypothetical protein
MPLFNQMVVRAAAEAKRKGLTKTASTILKEASIATRSRAVDIFLSHKYPLNSDLFADFLGLRSELTPDDVLGVKSILEAIGLEVFVDWMEPDAPVRADVGPTTADWLRKSVENATLLLYLVSPGSEESRWMPWELGLADGMQKLVGTIPLVPGGKNEPDFEGREYLGLYPYVAFEVGSSHDFDVFVYDGTGKTPLVDWIRNRA